MHQLSVQQHLDAAPARVWAAMTSPAQWAAWMWPDSFVTVCRLDLRVAGRYHLGSSVAGIGVGGEYEVVEPPSRAAFTWQWDGEPEVTTVEIAIEARQDGAVLRLVHRGFADEATRDDHVQGWDDCLARLAVHLAAPDQIGAEVQAH